VLSNVLFKRISPHAEKVIRNYLCVFRKDRSIVQQIFSSQQIIEKTTEFGVTLYHLFGDFKSAYDAIYRGKLYFGKGKAITVTGCGGP
jgi:hypothetical protein